MRGRNQSDFPQIEALGEVETEEFILQRDRGELEKPDLRAHRKADGEIFGLSDGQAGFLQQRLERYPRLFGTRTGEARDSARGGWHSVEPLGIDAAGSVFHPSFQSTGGSVPAGTVEQADGAS